MVRHALRRARSDAGQHAQRLDKAFQPLRGGKRILGHSERQLESRGQAEPRGHAAHLLGDGRFHAMRGIVERGGDEILQHFAIVTDQRRIDRDPLHLVFAGHLHLHHARARLAFDLERRELLLHAAHVLLHLLRLLHQLADVALHFRGPRSLLPSLLPIVESTTLPSKRSTRSCTNPSERTARAASARRAARSPFSMATALAPEASPTETFTATPRPRCCSRAAFSLSW